MSYKNVHPTRDARNKLTEAIDHRCFLKHVLLKMSLFSTETTRVGVSILDFSGLKICNFIKKETPTKVLSCEIYKFIRTSFLQNPSGNCF